MSTNYNTVLFHFVPSSLQSGYMPWIFLSPRHEYYFQKIGALISQKCWNTLARCNKAKKSGGEGMSTWIGNECLGGGFYPQTENWAF